MTLLFYTSLVEKISMKPMRIISNILLILLMILFLHSIIYKYVNVVLVAALQIGITQSYSAHVHFFDLNYKYSADFSPSSFGLFLEAVIYFLSYFFYTVFLPIILIDVFIYFHSSMDVLDFTTNYIYLYTFMFSYDALFILFFYYLAKNATKAPSEDESQAEAV